MMQFIEFIIWLVGGASAVVIVAIILDYFTDQNLFK
jgi:hypothetical protein